MISYIRSYSSPNVEWRKRLDRFLWFSVIIHTLQPNLFFQASNLINTHHRFVSVNVSSYLLHLIRLARLAECRMCSRDRGERPDATGMDLEVLEVAEEGSYGRVFRCLDIHTGALVTMKQITMVRLSQGVPAPIIREVSLLKELHHANIVKLLRVGLTENRYVNLVFEHLDYDLHHFIVNRGYPKDALTVKVRFSKESD